MHIKFYRSTKKIVFLIILFILLVSHSKTALGQSVTLTKQKFGQLGQVYHSDRISADKYLDSVYSLTAQFRAEGVDFHKVISIYEGKKEYIKQLPEQLRNKKVVNSEGINALSILTEVIESYIKIKDTTAVYQTTRLADQIGVALKSKYPIDRHFMLDNDFFTLVRQHDIAILEGNQTKVGMLLDSMQALKITYKDQPTGYLDLNLFQWRTDHYLAIKNLDSARFYIKKFESIPDFFKNQRAFIDEYKAKLQAMQGDFRGSNTLLTSALAEERKAKAALMTEMDNLLYAHTEAENNQIALQKAEKVKEQQTSWLLFISLTTSVLVLAIYLIMLHQSRKAKAQVETLNNAANMQIIAMEEVKYQAVREEQQRLGQDLHDGLSSSIAGIRHQLETLSMATNDISLKNKLIAMQAEMTNAYNAARNKSHEWFSAAEEEQEQSFEQRIKLLTDNALPDSRYNKAIHIDDNSLIHVSMDTRIALLRIIQEAITNIIKHAGAKNVDILIYEEVERLILVINDDGKGLVEQKFPTGKSTMGLQSIRRRVQYLNGETKIHSDAKGTEILMSIPLGSSK